MANFTDNTTQLQSLLEKVNALPEAGSGGSGGVAVKTCKLESIVMGSTTGSTTAYATILDSDGNLTTGVAEAVLGNSLGIITLDNIVCDSAVLIVKGSQSDLIVSGTASIVVETADYAIIRAPSVADGSFSIC